MEQLSEQIEQIELATWDRECMRAYQDRAIPALEAGKILFFPHLLFPLGEDERPFLSSAILSPKSKNLSYTLSTDRLGGTLCRGAEYTHVKAMIKRYAEMSRILIESLCPGYVSYLDQGRTSFRPVEAAGRELSQLKDDTLLHVDSFPATPVQGKRILRVFSNVNYEGKPRVWQVGAPFAKVVASFRPALKNPLFAESFFLKLFKVTKGYRSPYDHYMLALHNAMKRDPSYQASVKKHRIAFPAGSTWIVYTDQVSHAALSGQHLFEQTFYLPPHAMQDEQTTPLRILENFLQKKLV